MATITIRNVDEPLRERLLERARERGHSIEEEARHILRAALEQPAAANLADLAEALFGDDGIKLEPHPPVPVRRPAPVDT